MGRQEKLEARLKSKPKDFSFEEMESLLRYKGFAQDAPGKTGGSRVRFIHKEKNVSIYLHKPHPQNAFKDYALQQVIDILTAEGLL